jgi:antitoxin CcdA
MRMSHAHPAPSSSRRAVNLSVDRELIDAARELGIPLSSTLEEALRIRVLAAREHQWLADNAEAIGAYNERVGREGTFGEQFGNI